MSKAKYISLLPRPKTLTESAIETATPAAFYVEPEVTWGLQTSREPALIMDKVLGLVDKYYSGFPEALKGVYSIYFGDAYDLMEELKNFQKTLGLPVSESTWSGKRNVIDEVAKKVRFIYELIDFGYSASLDEFMGLLKHQQETKEVFTPQKDEPAYFPIFTAWSAMYITLYRSVLCDETWFNKFGASERRAISEAYEATIAHQVEVGAIVESAYNTWFLNNKRYKYANDIRVHFELRFAFDYTIVIGAAHTQCHIAVKEAIIPQTYSGFPLFYNEIIDNEGDERMAILGRFYTSVMAYGRYMTRLRSLGIQHNEWDNSHSFRGGVMRWVEGSYDLFGDVAVYPLDLTGWELDACRVRGMQYEFGELYDRAMQCGGHVQTYRDKDCLNKFKATVDCTVTGTGGTTWQIGHEFHEPNVVIGDRKTRVFNRFVGYKTKDNDSGFENCKYYDKHGVWVAPHHRTPLLDMLLAVYRIDAVDYITA